MSVVATTAFWISNFFEPNSCSISVMLTGASSMSYQSVPLMSVFSIMLQWRGFNGVDITGRGFLGGPEKLRAPRSGGRPGKDGGRSKPIGGGDGRPIDGGGGRSICAVSPYIAGGCGGRGRMKSFPTGAENNSGGGGRINYLPIPFFGLCSFSSC